MKTSSSLWILFLLLPVALRAQQPTLVAYEGKQIAYKQHQCKVQEMARLQGIAKHSYQGMDIWNNYMVSLQNKGFITIYQLDEEGNPTKLGETFSLASAHELNHSNVASFTTRFLDPNDKLPLLYVTRCNGKKDAQGRDKVAYVERIDPDRGTAQLVQTIWLRDDDKQLFGASTQWVVDRSTGFLYGYGNTIGNTNPQNMHRIMKFRLPELKTEADTALILTADDALENYLIEDYYNLPITPAIIQGADIRDGLLFLPTGVGDERRPSVLYVWDLAGRCMRNVIDLQQAIPTELEDCAAYGNVMMVQTQGKLYKISF